MAEKAVVKVKSVPKIRDAKGVLLKLSKKNFPKTKKGRMAFCDYMIAVYQMRRAKIESGQDDREKIASRIEKEEAKLKKLRADLKRLE